MSLDNHFVLIGVANLALMSHKEMGCASAGHGSCAGGQAVGSARIFENISENTANSILNGHYS